MPVHSSGKARYSDTGSALTNFLSPFLSPVKLYEANILVAALFRPIIENGGTRSCKNWAMLAAIHSFAIRYGDTSLGLFPNA
jgi:hypothetical protein